MTSEATADPTSEATADRTSEAAADPTSDSEPLALPRGVSAKLAYHQSGVEALRRASELLGRARAHGIELDGGAYSALVCAHAAMRSEEVASILALEASGKRVPLQVRRPAADAPFLPSAPRPPA